MADRWLTIAQAAVRAGRTERTIRNWIAAGELTPLVGRFRESDVVRAEHRMRAKRGRPRKDAQA